MIPKVIYQTWKTQNIHKKINNLHKRMLKANPEYQHIIYTDDQMLDFVKSNYDKDIFRYFERINNIVARADFWRYLILFKKGGVYLDIDSIINKNLDEILEEEDEALITAEKNLNRFAQWSLIFNKNHPILEKTIENLITNIHENKHKNNVLYFSAKPYWDAINSSFMENDLQFSWDMINENTNELFFIKKSNFRIYSIDYGKYISFKHKFNHLLRDRKKNEPNVDHWSISQKLENVFD